MSHCHETKMYKHKENRTDGEKEFLHRRGMEIK